VLSRKGLSNACDTTIATNPTSTQLSDLALVFGSGWLCLIKHTAASPFLLVQMVRSCSVPAYCLTRLVAPVLSKAVVVAADLHCDMPTLSVEIIIQLCTSSSYFQFCTSSSALLAPHFQLCTSSSAPTSSTFSFALPALYFQLCTFSSALSVLHFQLHF
jgi:hypothetical protein